MWTSAMASQTCTNTLGWCNEYEKEFVNSKALEMPAIDTSGKKECFAVTFQQIGNNSHLNFFTDECRAKKIALCEEV
jgi:hypothetical protein